MEQKEIIILVAVAAAAFFILKKPAAGTTGTGTTGTGTTGTGTTGTGTAGTGTAGGAGNYGNQGPMSWEMGFPQTSEAEAKWPYSYLTPNSNTSPNEAPITGTLK